MQRVEREKNEGRSGPHREPAALSTDHAQAGAVLASCRTLLFPADPPVPSERSRAGVLDAPGLLPGVAGTPTAAQRGNQ
ncbi:hypothetical protein AB0442_08315 [Kitasatospora sp. NPDC085895]|uniref:hypothetical protein n=1 Tax=Kitasatospora sp. NPDC085895 TaxID=3155057 RepID=UPI00344E5C12